MRRAPLDVLMAQRRVAAAGDRHPPSSRRGASALPRLSGLLLGASAAAQFSLAPLFSSCWSRSVLFIDERPCRTEKDALRGRRSQVVVPLLYLRLGLRRDYLIQ
jgi:hypothetical protein